MASSEAVPFGITVSAESLEGARKFYTEMYPGYDSVTEGVFGTIKYFSLIGKDGEVLVNVLQKQADNPVHGAIPMLKVDSVCRMDGEGRGSGRHGRNSANGLSLHSDLLCGDDGPAR